MDIISLFKENRNSENRPSMEAYMRDQFKFLGIKTPERHKLAQAWLKEEVKRRAIDWELVDKLWNEEEREFQYLACDYLSRMKKFLQKEDLPRLAELAQQKSCWDSVDNIDELVGILVERYPELKEEMLAWSTDDNIWLRRIAIDHQLQFKDQTDENLLGQIIMNNFGSDEFFINKAIGWSLRAYSKVNSQWVREFIDENKDSMDKLSIREGSKYLD